jgi:proline iminopeptidase
MKAREVMRPPVRERRELYPALEPYRHGYLRVSDVHEIYYEESGNPAGKPAVFLHGGPGAGSDKRARQFFDPRHYRIVVFDQRGCGRSRPSASLIENTTWHLVADIERLRKHLGIERWLVFGGSWGSTLALAYAEANPERVTEIVLRGIFLLRYAEIRWFYQHGASDIFPDAWEPYRDAIPPDERDDYLSAYHKRLTGTDQRAALAAARAWSMWEASASFLHSNLDNIKKWGEDQFALAVARIECHYFVNRGFLRSESQLIDDVPRIRHIPATIRRRICASCRMRDIRPSNPATRMSWCLPPIDTAAADVGARLHRFGTVDGRTRNRGDVARSDRAGPDLVMDSRASPAFHFRRRVLGGRGATRAAHRGLCHHAFR